MLRLMVGGPWAKWKERLGFGGWHKVGISKQGRNFSVDFSTLQVLNSTSLSVFKTMAMM